MTSSLPFGHACCRGHVPRLRGFPTRPSSSVVFGLESVISGVPATTRIRPCRRVAAGNAAGFPYGGASAASIQLRRHHDAGAAAQANR